MIDISDSADAEVPSAVLDMVESCWERLAMLKIERKYRGGSWVYLKERIPLSDDVRSQMDPESIAQRAMEHARVDMSKRHAKPIDSYRLEFGLLSARGKRAQRRVIQFRVKPAADGEPELVQASLAEDKDLVVQLRGMLTDQHDMTMRADEAGVRVVEALAKVTDKLAETLTAASEMVAHAGSHTVARAQVEADATVEAERIRSRSNRQAQTLEMLTAIIPAVATTWAAVQVGTVPQAANANTTAPPTDQGSSSIARQIGTWFGTLPKEKAAAMRENIGERGSDLLDSAIAANTDDEARAILFELRDMLMEDGGAKVKTLGAILGPHALALTSILSQL